ncbi:MAG: hypothetical protein HY645_13680 [Acidobacteria bacterium]|nr:hypothetical protein [Acidobacteriota bacterium]
MKQPSPRVLAVRLLQEVLSRKHLGEISEDADFEQLEPRDRRLVLQLVYGVLSNRELLRFYLKSLAQEPSRKVDSVVSLVVWLALYQIEFLRVPERAAVHEAVQLCEDFDKPFAKGFVNAVLRQFIRQKPPLPAGDSAEELSIRFSHPVWLVRRYISRYGRSQALALMERNNRPPEPSLWVNPFQISLLDFCAQLEKEQISYELYPALPDCVLVSSPAFTQHRLYRKGFCFFMDVSSQKIAYLPDLEGKKLLADFCAAPGGKSFIIAARKVAGSTLVCCEVSARRLWSMKARSQQAAVPGLSFVQADLQQSAPFRCSFEFALLDVPCSGLGTLRSNPDIRWKIQEEDLQNLKTKQLRLLRNGFDAVGKGGELIYSTCSTEPEENEQVVEQFLSEDPRAELQDGYFRSFPGSSSGVTDSLRRALDTPKDGMLEYNPSVLLWPQSCLQVFKKNS